MRNLIKSIAFLVIVSALFTACKEDVTGPHDFVVKYVPSSGKVYEKVQLPFTIGPKDVLLVYMNGGRDSHSSALPYSSTRQLPVFDFNDLGGNPTGQDVRMQFEYYPGESNVTVYSTGVMPPTYAVGEHEFAFRAVLIKGN